jgi:hypothetical protein
MAEIAMDAHLTQADYASFAINKLCDMVLSLREFYYGRPAMAIMERSWAMDSNIVKFPFSVSRRAHARKPRASKNGTPEQRASVQEMVAESRAIDDRPAPGVTATAQNGHLRQDLKEAWRMAEAAVRYWRTRVDFEDAVSSAQRMGLPEGRSHAPLDDDRMSKVKSWRAAIVRQLLTPAPDAASVKWKQAAWARDNYLAVKPERIERAIADDLAFLAAHPVRQSNRRRQGWSDVADPVESATGSGWPRTQGG